MSHKDLVVGMMLRPSLTLTNTAVTGTAAVTRARLLGSTAVVTWSLLSGSDANVASIDASTGDVSLTSGLGYGLTNTFGVRAYIAATKTAYERWFQITGAAPILNALTLDQTVYTAALTAGSSIATVSGKTSSSTITVSASDVAGMFAVSSDGTQLLAGLNYPSATGIYGFSLTETNPAGSTKTTSFTCTVLAKMPVLANQYLSNGSGWTGPTIAPDPVGDPGGVGYTRNAIVRFNNTPYDEFTDTYWVTVYAYHISGIAKVRLAANGGAWVDVTSVNRNPSTGEVGYTVGVRASDFPDGSLEVRAEAIPNCGVPTVLGGYNPNGNTVANASVTATSVNCALPAGTECLVTNTGTNTAYYNLGVDNTVGAAVSNGSIPAGKSVVVKYVGFTTPAYQYIAFVCASGKTTTLTFAGGSGPGRAGLILNANSGGTLPRPVRWVSLTGSNSNDGLTKVTAFADTTAAAVAISAANGGDAGGGIIYLTADGGGQHTLGRASGDNPINCTSRWLTIMPEPGAVYGSVQIVAQGSIYGIKAERLKVVGIPRTVALQESGGVKYLWCDKGAYFSTSPASGGSPTSGYTAWTGGLYNTNFETYLCMDGPQYSEVFYNNWVHDIGQDTGTNSTIQIESFTTRQWLVGSAHPDNIQITSAAAYDVVFAGNIAFDGLKTVQGFASNTNLLGAAFANNIFDNLYNVTGQSSFVYQGEGPYTHVIFDRNIFVGTSTYRSDQNFSASDVLVKDTTWVATGGSPSTLPQHYADFPAITYTTTTLVRPVVAVDPVTYKPNIPTVVDNGSAIILNVGSWTNSPTLYVVELMADGVKIPGKTYTTTQTSITVPYSDLAGYPAAIIRHRVFAINAVDYGTCMSSPLRYGFPFMTAAPTLSTNSPLVGTPLTANPGTWVNSITSYIYQWYYNDTGALIAGATSSSYTPVVGDRTHPLGVIVGAVNANGTTYYRVFTANAAV